MQGSETFDKLGEYPPGEFQFIAAALGTFQVDMLFGMDNQGIRNLLFFLSYDHVNCQTI